MALIWHGNKVSSKIQNEARRRVREAALVVEKNAKGLMVRGGRTASGFLESIEGRRREPGTGKRPGKIGSYVSRPGEPPRVQTGTLRRSITHEMHPTLPIARVGTNVFYACILGGSHVTTKNRGQLTMGQLELGDMVLTQAGEYRPIEIIHRFPATEKPNLVEIECEYRKGKTHKLTVTPDHKILTQKNGAFLWIPAGELVVGDKLFSPRKIAHNAGQKVRVHVPCASCEKLVERTLSRIKYCGDNQFCGHKCRAKWLAKYHTGLKRSNETRLKISEKAIERYLNNPKSHPNYILARKGYETGPEKLVREWLDRTGWQYEKQHRVGKLWVDFIVPNKKLLIEADGAYWHSDQSKDIRRDKKLLSKLKGWSIIHLHFTEARFSKNIDPNPLPNVRYVQCNPSMESFVNGDRFVSKRVLSVRPYTYTNRGFSGGNRPPFLYDIGVKDFHSLVVNGILVSNSHLELGTPRMAKAAGVSKRESARPFMRPALHKSKKAIMAIFSRRMKD